MEVNVIGAGLAGVEASYYLANKGLSVNLYEQKKINKSPAHKSENFAELVCSNSLRSNDPNVAPGLLKKEMELFDSIVIKMAKKNQVPAGSALAVDRENFSKDITDVIMNHPNITVVNEEVAVINEKIPTIIATGPLTSDKLSNNIKSLLGEDYFYFFDAAAPIIEKDTINMDIAYMKSRYDKGEASYINCPMSKEEFEVFYTELINAKCVEFKEFEMKVFEGCMPVETMASRGNKTLLFGPMKPVGLRKPNGETPYAVVQLRQDNAVATLYNMVGFQTHLTWGEQKRVFRLIPGLENAEFVKYGVMHRNSFINSPKLLSNKLHLLKNDNIYFAGQITGVEGYIESASSGIMAAYNLYRRLNSDNLVTFPLSTAMGSLSNYITSTSSENFQPMNINFGIIEQLGYKVSKKDKKAHYSNRAIKEMENFIQKYGK